MRRPVAWKTALAMAARRILDAVSRADLAAFAAQSPQLAKRYRA